MIRFSLISNQRLKIETVEGVNDRATLFIGWLNPNDLHAPAIVGRGVRQDRSSCIFKGNLEGTNLTVNHKILGPEDRPKTEAGQQVYAIEDPKVLQPEWNFVEPGKHGLICAEAYYLTGKQAPLGTNLIYVSLDGKIVRTLATPEIVEQKLKKAGFDRVTMLKIPAYVQTRTGQSGLVFEVGAQLRGHSKSHLVYAEIIGDQLGDMSLFLEPLQGKFYNHVSPGAHFLPLTEDQELVIFNGSGTVTRDNKEINRWAVWTGVYSPSRHSLTWIADEPLLTCQETATLPPASIDPADVPQEIAFASDARLINRDGEMYLEVLYHVQDEFVCLAEFKVSSDSLNALSFEHLLAWIEQLMSAYNKKSNSGF